MGGRFLLKIPRGGGGLKEGEGPRGQGGCLGELGNFGGGLNILFRGRNVHQERKIERTNIQKGR